MKKILFFIICVTFLFSGCVKQDEPTKQLDTNKHTEDISATEKTQEVNSDLENNSKDIDALQEKTEKFNVENKIIVIDAGHGINSYNKQEAIAPGVSETKIAFASGTSGVNQTEEQLNLSVALNLQKKLEDMGAKVYMTRTEHNSDMTNIDRALFANELKADISVKIHADGSNNSSVHGVSVLVPGNQYISDSTIIEKSRIAGEYILEEFVKETCAVNRGISVRNDLTGFNWTQVPIVLVEMGFMTNPEEDALMETVEYQDKISIGIIGGLERYFEE